MIFENLFIRIIGGCIILASVTSAVGPAGYETIRKTIDMMGAVESAQENNASGYGGRKGYSKNNEEKNFPVPQHLVARGRSSFSYVAAAGPSVVISTGPNSPTIFYTAPAGGISISRELPGASYVVSTYPGVISSLPSSAGTGVSIQAYNNNVKVIADPSVQAASMSVDPAHSSSSSPAENLPKKENNYYSSYPALSPVVSISADDGGPDSSSIINLGGYGGPTAASLNGYYGYPALVAAQRNLQGASQLISRIASALRL